MIGYAKYFTDARIKNYVGALLRVGCTVDVFALGQSEPVSPGLRVFLLMSKALSTSALPYAVSQLLFLVKAFFRVGLASVTQRYDVVHVHNMPNFTVFAATIPKLLGAKVILDVHDTMPEAYATKFGLQLDHPIIRLMKLEERVSAAFADHVITTNDLHKETLVDHGIVADKISIVMNVGDDRIFHPRNQPKHREFLTLGYHGTIAERLGVDLILRAIQQVRGSCPNLRFNLIGNGEYLPEVRRLIIELGLSDVVELEGWVPVEDLPKYLAVVDVGVVGNRRYTEGQRNWMLPVKMLEYAAMEIPTIAPRLRIIEHYFSESSAILYHPDSVEDLARCIREVYERPDSLIAVKRGLREFNARYNWSDMEARYLGLIDDLTGNCWNCPSVCSE